MSAAAITVAALLVASPSITEADRIAANGGFMLGNAHRCGVQDERVVRAGQFIRTLITAAAPDEAADEEATARFSAFFLVSAVADPKEEKLVASCRKVKAEFGRFEKHQLALGGPQVGTDNAQPAHARPATRSPRPGDGE